MSYSLKQTASKKAFSCTLLTFTHTSPTLGNTVATFSVILPPKSPSPLLYWLSGLTCTNENFLTKAGAAQHCAQHNVAIVIPDTSPRGANIPGEDDDWDLGTGAGFYVDATTEGWKDYYRMASYIADELPKVVQAAVGDKVVLDVCSVFGHSMGGMGALNLALRERGKFVSVSAFSPIANPVECEWGKKCFTAYLGKNREDWEEYDPTCLMRRGAALRGVILVEQGTADPFLESQLMVGNFVKACREMRQEVVVNMQEGYDHSYFFIQTFVGKHIEFHAKELRMALERRM